MSKAEASVGSTSQGAATAGSLGLSSPVLMKEGGPFALMDLLSNQSRHSPRFGKDLGQWGPREFC